MRLTLCAVGRKMPAWVTAGAGDYAKRLPASWSFEVREVPQASGGDVVGRTAREGDALLAALERAGAHRRTAAHVVALDERGKAHTTAALAGRLEHWQALGRDIVLLVGGADGLHADVLARADERWSLSPLTFPHPLVRIVVIEQLYRAHSLLAGHPYHRA